jgi:ActR/RegA family two-component response regulator
MSGNAYRVLVVEDDVWYHENLYPIYLSKENVNIDYAESKVEALEKIRCKTYDVAFVDIMLKEDRTDRGGVEVIVRLNELDEGTNIIVVSATDDIKVALVAHRSGIVAFLQKDELGKPEDLEVPFHRAVDRSRCERLNLFGRFKSMSAYFASPDFVPAWEDDMLRTLKVNYEVFNRRLMASLERFLPLLRRRDSKVAFKVDRAKRSVSGHFWSKGEGCPVWVSFCSEEGEIDEPPVGIRGDLLHEHRKGPLHVSILRMNGAKRDDYYETAREL